ncbi:hypothetical protein [Lacinutrix cladophorae]
MSNFKIGFCDDSKGRVGLINAMIRSLKSQYDFIQEPKEISFKDILENNILDTLNLDLLILDLYDEKTDKWLGIDALELIKTSGLNVQTIIFSGDKEGAERNRNFSKEYKFVISEIDKNKGKIGGLSELIEEELLNKLPNQYLMNENDLVLKLQISSIGENNLNQIFKIVKDKFEIEDKIEIKRMVSGYSGAVLFKFTHKSTSYILKASKEIQKLSQELKNSKEYYHKFPSRFFNYIDSEEIKTKNGEVLSMIIKLIDDGKTLFDFIKENNEVGIFDKIFTNDYRLKSHYKKNRGKKHIWCDIFERFSNEKYSVIDSIAQELSPLLSMGSNEFNLSNIKNLIKGKSFENLDINKLKDQNYQVLNHGDLHSRNILIEGDSPYLIDTGGIDYSYWCSDICRLVVDLFIKGLDNGRKEYYDINKISDNVSIGKLLIKRDSIDLDKVNDNYINSINWLSKNVEIVYDDLFFEYQYQLGLMKEFLQVSYRVDTIPPNKRAIALLLAYQCMMLANKNVYDKSD